MKDVGVRMAVLEEKLNVYEELSREMLAKLESAVDKISEANQSVAKILVRHEERLDKNADSDAAILKLLDEMKAQNAQTLNETKKNHEDSLKEVKDKLKDHETRITDLSKVRWLLWGALLTLGFIIGEGRPLTRLLHLPPIEAPAVAPQTPVAPTAP